MGTKSVERHRTREILREPPVLLDRLRTHLDGFRIRREEFNGDFALHGFLSTCWENASAAFTIVSHAAQPAMAYPSALRAFESAVDALLLATDDAYDILGARARVWAWHELTGIGGDPPSRRRRRSSLEGDLDRLRRAVHEEASYLDELSRRSGGAVRTAWLEIVEQGRTIEPCGGAIHWSGLTRRRMVLELTRRLRTRRIGRGLWAAYVDLSRNASPRFQVTRVDQRSDIIALSQIPRSTRRLVSHTLTALELACRAAERAAETRSAAREL